MIDTQNLNLFGLDLEMVFRRLVLGWRQLLFDDSSPIKSHFHPADRFQNLEDLSQRINAEAALPGDKLGVQLLAPECDVLEFPLTLPASVEPYLIEAVAAQIAAATPFQAEETCWGYVISDRSSQELTLALLIISRTRAEECIATARAELKDGSASVDLWAKTSSAMHAPFIQFQSNMRRDAYLVALRGFTIKYAVGLIGLLCLLCTPVVLVMQNVDHYQRMLNETESRTGRVVEIRAGLVQTSQQVSDAVDFFSGQHNYRPWLHKIAAWTPDSIYLNRMSFDGGQLTISGLAENAADYQSALSQEPALSNLLSPSAFTRDGRSGRERFTLTMELERVGEL